MQNQINQTSEPKNSDSLDILEIISVVASVGGSLISIVVNQAALASIPLSACVVFNLLNRNRILTVKAQEQQIAIATITTQVEEEQTKVTNNFEQLTTEVEQLTANLNQNYQKLQERDDLLEQKQQQLEQLIQELSKIEHITQNIVVNNSPDSYFELANYCEQSGDKPKAVELYTEVIKRNRRDARVYQQRGLLFAELGDKQQAIQDLRLAAKFYFEQGDLENYEQAKTMTNELYQLKDSNPIPNDNPIVLGNLFA
jgi:tetratricopeptide (TPR) repeat protein